MCFPIHSNCIKLLKMGFWEEQKVWNQIKIWTLTSLVDSHCVYQLYLSMSCFLASLSAPLLDLIPIYEDISAFSPSSTFTTNFLSHSFLLHVFLSLPPPPPPSPFSISFLLVCNAASYLHCCYSELFFQRPLPFKDKQLMYFFKYFFLSHPHLHIPCTL